MHCMKKATTILFMFFYGLGILLCPSGDFSCSQSLSQEYNHCKSEDTDIDAIDFVFEHLLNLDPLINNFEKDSDHKNDKPHQPLQQAQTSSPISVLVSRSIHYEVNKTFTFPAPQVIYPAYKGNYIPSGYLTEIFHPPSVC